MSLQDTVLDIVKEHGPMLPAEIVSEVHRRTGKQSDMFFIGAVLSELMIAKQMKMSHAKIGGSKVYYTPGQEPKLVKLKEYLNEKDKRAYELLEEKKVLRNSDVEPIIRVALSTLKDFARPIEVKLQEKEVFWYWYLLPLEEAQKLIKESLKSEIEELHKNKETTVPSKPVEQAVQQTRQHDGFIGTSYQQPSPAPSPAKEQNTEKRELEPTKQKPEPVQESSKEMQSTLSHVDTEDEFMQSVKKFLDKNNIPIHDAELLRKNSECEFEVTITSQIGNIRYYIYAKSKKKLSETDLSYAYVRAQNKNLPLCFISPGDLTKKAEEALKTDLKAANYLKMH
jgi:hypothetical protein